MVPEEDTATKVSYLLHQPVVCEQAETTKVRAVYDASCKDRATKISLNYCLNVGIAINPLMFDILVRLREHLVVVIGKAFLDIEVHDGDRDCLRGLWVQDIHAANPEVIVYRFERVAFGVNSSPFLLKKNEEIDPRFVD